MFIISDQRLHLRVMMIFDLCVFRLPSAAFFCGGAGVPKRRDVVVVVDDVMLLLCETRVTPAPATPACGDVGAVARGT